MSSTGARVQEAGWYEDPTGLARHRYWDGAHWTSRTSKSKVPDDGSPALSAGFARMADWLGHLLKAQVALLVALVLVVGWGWTTVSASGVRAAVLFDTTTAPSEQLADDLGVVLLVGLVVWGLWFLLYAATAVLWLVWQAQLAGSAPGQLRRGATMQVVAWFVPLLNIVWPYQDVRDLWRSYSPGPEDHEASPVGLWWGLYLGLPTLWSFISLLLVVRSDAESVWGRVVLVYAGWFVLEACLALVARGVVHKLSWRALRFWALASG